MGEATFTFRVDDDLKEAFSEAARTQDRTAAQLLRDYMREVVQRRREDEDYEAWLRQKVEAARASIRAGRGTPAHEVSAEFAALRKETSRGFDRPGS
jgi:predicted transcriptional regulator